MKKNSYTRTPVTIEAINVPPIANVTMAPKFEKKGFCKGRNNGVNHTRSTLVELHANWSPSGHGAHRHTYLEIKVLSTYRWETET